jgi:hypothetical protein
VFGCRPQLVSDVPPVPPTLTNGPDEDVELNTVYHTASGEAVQDTEIELDDFAVAVTPVGGAVVLLQLYTAVRIWGGLEAVKRRNLYVLLGLSDQWLNEQLALL